MTYRRVLVAAVAISLFLLPISAQQSRVTGPRGRTVPRTTNSQAVSAPAVSPDIVISQVYGGGGNSGATYTNDFIEIFNLSTSAVSVNGWTVQYASATGGSWTTTALTGTIQPGAHYLIQEAAGAGGTTGLPTPDATGSIAMASAAGKVALVTNATALTCGATNNCTSASIRDLVGYGTTATAWEGSAPTANLTNTTAAIRLSNGCVDTDSNSADFTTSGAPNPRNTASSPTPCSSSNSPTGVGSASPNNPAAGAAVTITVTVTPGTNPASTGTTVVADLTSIGGLQGQSLYDDGTNGDVTAGDNIFTFATIVAAGTSGGVKTIPFTVNDSLDRATTGNFQLTVQGTSNPSGTGSANPNTVAAGGSTTLTVTVTPGALPASTGIAVTANLSSIGGSASQTFTDGGSNTFTFPATVSAGTANGAKTLPFTITDAQGRSGGGNISLVVGTNTDPSRATPAEHEVMGNPDGSSNTDNDHWLIERPQYVESYNCSKGIPNWVEWHLDNTWTGSVTRQNNYRADTAPPLPTSNCYIVQGNDYSGSGFDRGHNVPSADRQDTIADNSSTFLMPNFIPQAPNNNQITWNNMEDYIRTQIQSGANEAYIWMGNAGQGGVGSNSTAVVNTVANGHVVVPAYVWKVVMILPTGGSDLSRVDTNTRVFAALTPNVQSGSGLNGNWQTYICPVSKIEQLTGLNFFPNVPTATAAVLKSKIDSAIAPQTVASGTMTNLTLAYPETYMT
ncbi:MAG: DNA/RNA non-specific endonuclease, partial [Acidobacteria bacterium]|nr:DNA/RNA non-specific endonuclease [Acidobacteriota bacterium]